MSEIIKSGVMIDGIEITSEHIGKKLEVVETESNHWLPVGFIATITGVTESEISLQDIGGPENCYEIENEYINSAAGWEFKWTVEPKPKKTSTKSQRQKLAKAIKEAKKVLDDAVEEAENVGMVVDISKDSVKITFNPPLEEY